MVLKTIFAPYTPKSKKTKKMKPTVASQLRRHRDILLTGRILCIDPSIGSSSSSCGYAIVEAGKMIDCGVINVDITGNHSERLYELTDILRREFKEPDLILIEKIAVYLFRKKYGGKGSGFSTATALVLHRVIGAVLSIWKMRRVIEIPPQLWHSYTDRSTYEKSDVNDAVMLWECALAILNEPIESPSEKKKEKKTKKVKTEKKEKPEKKERAKRKKKELTKSKKRRK